MSITKFLKPSYRARLSVKKLSLSFKHPYTMAPDPGYCGWGPFQTGPEDPFWQSHCCPNHDDAYEAHLLGQPTPPRSEIDKDFLNCCLKTANGNLLLQARAYSYYTLVRIIGALIWALKI